MAGVLAILCAWNASAEPSNSLYPYYSCGQSQSTGNFNYRPHMDETAWKGYTAIPCSGGACLRYSEIIATYGIYPTSGGYVDSGDIAALGYENVPDIPVSGYGTYTFGGSQIVVSPDHLFFASQRLTCTRNNPGVGEDVFKK